MNEYVLKSLSLGMFGAVVCLAMLLANAVQLAVPEQQKARQSASVPVQVQTASYLVAARAERAASAPVVRLN